MEFPNSPSLVARYRLAPLIATCLLSSCKIRTESMEERHADSRSENSAAAEISQSKFDSSVEEIGKSLEAAKKQETANSKDTGKDPTQAPTTTSTPSPSGYRADLLGALNTKRGERDYRIKFSVSEYGSSDVKDILMGYGKQRTFGRIENFCKCGETTDITVIWEFQGQKGTFETLKHGEFIIGHYPPHDWRKRTSFEGLVGGQHDIFFGADSDGDGRCGIFECDHKHKWRNHDDIRGALACNLAQCPADKINSTVLKVRFDPSHGASDG